MDLLGHGMSNRFEILSLSVIEMILFDINV